MSDGDALYTRMQDLAVQKIKQYGKPIVLRVSGGTSNWTKFMNPATGTYAWRNNTTKAVVAVDPTQAEVTHKGFGLQDRYKGLSANNANIQLGDIRLYAIGIPEPKTGDLITMNSKTRTVVTANPVQPGDAIIMWDIQLR